ncbi:uncharacterized protein A4U43_C03F11070 [Asparagus officinalis]|uniref:Uncharacterized protein n=1 Tax=Asparagus officinalis TaxID=4686 RepID=A0A5P1FE92_ASPOF|nr:uncharacterized protein A4U43_C03F11070 [Asparagus officinalis]
MAVLGLHLPLPPIYQAPSPKSFSPLLTPPLRPTPARPNLRLRSRAGPVFSVGNEEAELRVSVDEQKQQTEVEEVQEATPEDLEHVEQIKRVLELLRRNRDMTFGEVKLTIMIEDPRDVERKRLLGIEDPDELTRDDLAAALEDVCAQFCE